MDKRIIMFYCYLFRLTSTPHYNNTTNSNQKQKDNKKTSSYSNSVSVFVIQTVHKHKEYTYKSEIIYTVISDSVEGGRSRENKYNKQ